MKQTIKKELILLEDLGMQYATETSKEKKRYGLYECFCGKEFKTIISDVKSGGTKSCGCEKGNKKHNLSSHRLYNTWKAIIQRCNNPKIKDYKDYGLRGITVCNEWLDINNFINDMYPSYKEGLTIDRIDSNGNYEKANCRWANKNTQSRNTRLLQTNNSTGYRGVSKKGNRYVSRVGVNTKIINLGCYNTALDAAKAYDQYVIDNNLEHSRNFK